jgi:hypothetical protein
VTADVLWFYFLTGFLSSSINLFSFCFLSAVAESKLHYVIVSWMKRRTKTLKA